MTAADAAETLELSFSFVSVGLRVNVARRAAGAHWTGQRLSVSRDTAALCVGEVVGVRSQTHRKSCQEGLLP